MRRRLLYSTRTRRAGEDELWRGERRMNSTQPRCSFLTDTDAVVRDDHEQSITVKASCTQTTLRHLDQQHDASYWLLYLTKYHTIKNVQYRLRSWLIWAERKHFYLELADYGATQLFDHLHLRIFLVYLLTSRYRDSIHHSAKQHCLLAVNHGVGNTTENSKVFSLIQISQLVPARTCKQ